MPDSSGDSGNNGWAKDAENLLGFLLAGFAGIVGFFGLRSDEVTSVLRNYSSRASVIALILLLAILVAIAGIAVPRSHSTSRLRAAAVFLALLSGGAALNYYIPIPIASLPLSDQQVKALVIAAILALLALIALALSFLGPPPVSLAKPDGSGGAGRIHRIREFANRSVPTQFACIFAAVILLAASIYGAMRLETDSQLNTSVDISASLARDTGGLALSVHVSGIKIRTSGYIVLVILGLPISTHVAAGCRVPSMQQQTQCRADPCRYLRTCRVIFVGNVPPDADGNISETVSDGLIPGLYSDLSIRAKVCQALTGCDSAGAYIGRLDIHLPRAAGPPGAHGKAA